MASTEAGSLQSATTTSGRGPSCSRDRATSSSRPQLRPATAQARTLACLPTVCHAGHVVVTDHIRPE